MKVSVVVPTFNRREIVLRTLTTLNEQDLPVDQYEVIVVVDGSTDGTADAIRSLRMSCPLRVVEQENRGLAGARNTGWKHAQHELIVFLDDDMLCNRSLLQAHLAAQPSCPEAIGVGAVLLQELAKTVAQECFNREVGAYALRNTADLGPLPLSDCIFGNTSIRKSLLLKTAGFDERLRMREDTELAVRLRRLGARPIFVRNAVAHQFYDKSAADLIADAEAFAEADVLFLELHPDAQEETFAGKIAREPGWKRALRTVAASVPALSDVVAAPLRWLGEACPKFPQLLGLGARALQVQRGVHYYRRVRELQRGSSPQPGERE